MNKELDLRGSGMTSPRTRTRLVDRLRAGGIQDETVLGVIASTPRHIFVDEALSHRAYEDTALPIGFNQTISQPYIVARMTEILFAEGPLESVLEVGTGSGYQTAILAQMATRVFSVERIKALLEKARDRLRALNLRNVMIKHADGGMGWPDKGPFDGILVTASPRVVPAELLDQLKPGGRLVIPVGEDQAQRLILVRRTEDGFEEEFIEEVRFVPLLGGLA